MLKISKPGRHTAALLTRARYSRVAQDVSRLSISEETQPIPPSRHPPFRPEPDGPACPSAEGASKYAGAFKTGDRMWEIFWAAFARHQLARLSLLRRLRLPRSSRDHGIVVPVHMLGQPLVGQR